MGGEHTGSEHDGLVTTGEARNQERFDPSLGDEIAVNLLMEVKRSLLPEEQCEDAPDESYEGPRNNQLEDRERGRAHTIFVELQGGQQGSGDTLNQDARVGALTSSSHGEKGRKKYLQRSMML